MVAEDVAPAVALSCAEMALSGTTTFCDQYFFGEEIAGAAGRAGLRAVIAYGIVQLGDEVRGAEETRQGPPPSSRASARPTAASSRGSGRMRPMSTTPRRCSPRRCASPTRLGCGIHLHMACGPEDNEETLARYGTTASVALEKAGFFGGRIHAAHCLDLSDEDIAVFARAEAASVAHCASAGLRSGREAICPVVPLKRAGVTVALGTDNVAANNSYDMVAEMRVAGLVASHRERRAQPLSSRELVRMADHRRRPRARARA